MEGERDRDTSIRRLHDEHAPALLAWARRRFPDHGEADDIVQETFLRAWRHAGQFDSERGSERMWLFGIARNVATDLHRRRERRVRLVSAGEAPIIDLDAEDDLVTVEDRSRIIDAFRALTPEHRVVVVEGYLLGRSTNEIADRLGIPAGTVKSRMYYALRALRSALTDEGVGR